MKRWFLRTSALVALVVLGLIAIAQAQRGTPVQHPAAAEETLPPVVQVPSTARTPTPLLLAQEIPPRPLAHIEAARPLRPETMPAVSRETSGLRPFDAPAGVSLASSTERPDADARLASPAGAPADETGPGAELRQPGLPETRRSSPAVDPFGRPGPLLGVAGDTARPAKPASQELAGDPRSGPALMPLAAPASDRVSRSYGSPSAEPLVARSDRTLPPAGSEPAPLALDGGTPPSRLAPGDPRPMAFAPPATSPEPSVMEGQGQPGKQQLDGPQSPQVTIQKFAPEGVQVGKSCTFRTAVLNTGQIVAHGVEIRDVVPRGTQLVDTKPRASRGAGGELVWELGALKPGDEVSVEMEVMPVAEGELGSVATVHFNAEASARTVATKPELVLRATGPGKVLIGEEVVLSIEISNPGTGTATGVVLSERVPPGLQHPVGGELEYKVGTLAPGETRSLQLALTAARPGPVANLLVASGEGNLKAEHRVDVEVVAPQLEVNMEGPKRRYLEREATYVVSVSNPGTAPAKQVQLTAQLPRGLKFVSANGAAHFEPATQSVHWLLEELPPNDSGKVELVTLPIEAGEQRLRLSGRADRGLSAEKEQAIQVEGIAAIMFTLIDVNDPIERGGETVYEVRVVNQGSKASTNVRIVALLPAGMRAVAAEGPVRFQLDPQRVTFESLARLAPKADTTYRVRAQGLQPGDQRIRVQLLTDEMQDPVTKEESTRVYSDE